MFQNQKEFLQYAKDYYRTQCYIEDYMYWVSCRPEIIHWLYKLGRDYQVLNLDYNQFSIILKLQEDYHRYYNDDGSCQWYSCYWRRKDVSRRFRYTGQSKKNNPTKNDWWVERGISRDRSRHSGWGWRRCSQKYYKKQTARSHRQKEKRALYYEEWDYLCGQTYREMIGKHPVW